MEVCLQCQRELRWCGCHFDEDGPEAWDDAEPRPFGVDANGCPTELFTIGGEDVIVHHAYIPESDITRIDGLRCTTPLRTVIDLASTLERDHLDEVIADCLTRRLFTIEEARHRLAQFDLTNHPGAEVLRHVLVPGW